MQTWHITCNYLGQCNALCVFLLCYKVASLASALFVKLFVTVTFFNEVHDWGEQKVTLALSHRGTPEVPHPPMRKKKIL